MRTLLARALAETIDPSIDRIMKDRFWRSENARVKNAVVIAIVKSESQTR